MPRYALEIREPDGSISKGEHQSPEGTWYEVGHRLLYEGRLLRVAESRDAGGPFDQLLICTPE